MPRAAAPVSSSSEDEEPPSGNITKEKDANDARGKDSLHKRRQPFDPQFYRDNGLSKGGRMKEDFTILSELSSKLKKPANMACRVERFGNVVETLGPKKRSWVREMGLEGLLHLAGCRLPRSLCYWLCAHLDCARKELLTPDGVRFPMSKIQVHWVLGLPFGPRAVPNKIKGPVMKKKIKQIWDAYGHASDGGTKEIRGQTITEVVESTATNAMEFKRAFLMFALNELLCPTTCYRLSTKLLPAVTVSDNARYFDWCSLLLDHLFYYAARFAKQFYTDGFTKGCGDCTYFLAVFYLDRLRRSPLSWGAIPRIKFWSTQEVNKARLEDLKSSGDFGNLGCLDIAYGEAHPDVARDALPPTLQDQVDIMSSRDAHKFYVPTTSRYKKKKRNKRTNGNPYLRKVEKRQREDAEGGRQRQGGRPEEGAHHDEEHNIDHHDQHREAEDSDSQRSFSGGDEEADGRINTQARKVRRVEVVSPSPESRTYMTRSRLHEASPMRRPPPEPEADNDVEVLPNPTPTVSMNEVRSKRKADVQSSQKERRSKQKADLQSNHNEVLLKQQAEITSKRKRVSASVSSTSNVHNGLRDRVDLENEFLHAVVRDVCTSYPPESKRPKKIWGMRDKRPAGSSCIASSDSRQVSYRTMSDSVSRGDHFVDVVLKPPPGFETPAGPSIRVHMDRSASRKAALDYVEADSSDVPSPGKKGVAGHGTSSAVRTPSTVQRSRKQRVTCPPLKFSPAYVKAWRPLAFKPIRMKLAKAVLTTHAESEDDPVVLQSGGFKCHLSSAAAIVTATGHVDHYYIVVAAKINSKVWAHKWPQRWKKLMFTPFFSRDVITGWANFLWSRHAKELEGCEARSINAIFIPVMDGGIWWAAVFSFNRFEIRILDPTCSNKDSVQATLPKLEGALRDLLGFVFPGWKVRDFTTWDHVHSEYYSLCDRVESGVAMLVSLKCCEDRFQNTLIGQLDTTHRSWLLCEDLLSEHNEARDTVNNLLANFDKKT